MLPIDEVRLNFDPLTLNILNAILGFIVFGVSLDIRIEEFRNILRSPRPFLV
jgi:BASS family bile acid:Na+ symporter